MTELPIFDLAGMARHVSGEAPYSAQCNDVQFSHGMQGHAEAEPAAKRRRIEPAFAAKPLSQQATQPLNAAPEGAAASRLPFAKERALLVQDLETMAKQTGPAGEQSHKSSGFQMPPYPSAPSQ